MKKILLFLSVFATMTFSSYAQSVTNDGTGSVKEKQVFRFIYIAPDNNMSQQQLLAALNDQRNHIVSEGSPAIFYLVSNDNPIVVKFNMEGDNSEEFESQLLYGLRQTMSWNVEAPFDRKNICKMLGEYDYVDASGNIKYERVELNFHVGKTFWDRGNNESVIAALFFELNAAKYIEDKRMQFNVYFRCPPSKGVLDRDHPFGAMNLDDINQYVIPRVED